LQISLQEKIEVVPSKSLSTNKIATNDTARSVDNKHSENTKGATTTTTTAATTPNTPLSRIVTPSPSAGRSSLLTALDKANVCECLLHSDKYGYAKHF
jgi:hypothetical protein